ncbi:MAG: hypothetical protein ACRCZO_08950 [Cetobacterium sp.]
MIKKRVKVFSSGKYPQGNYPPERVKKIFGEASKSNAIFIHTSKWKDGEPPKVGEFSNFQIIENGKKVDVFANIELNEKGQVYHSDKIFKGISVEIPGDKLTNIALLPQGINPAVEGAEFEENSFIEPFDFEFEEDIKIMKFEDVLSFIFTAQLTVEQLTQLMRSLQLKVTDKQAVYNLAREFAAERVEIAAIEEVNPKTAAEIEKEFEAKFEKKLKAKESATEFMKINNNKITPAMKEILTEAKIETLYLNSDTSNYEFEGKKESPIELLTAIFDKMPQILKEGQVITEFEGKKEKEETPQEYAARIHGGN